MQKLSPETEHLAGPFLDMLNTDMNVRGSAAQQLKQEGWTAKTPFEKAVTSIATGNWLTDVKTHNNEPLRLLGLALVPRDPYPGLRSPEYQRVNAPYFERMGDLEGGLGILQEHHDAAK